MLHEAVDQGHADHGHIVHEDCTDMRHTGAEGLPPSLPRGNAQHCVEDQHIRDDDEQRVQPKSASNDTEPQNTVGPSVPTGQLDQI